MQDTNARTLTSHMVPMAKYRVMQAPGNNPRANLKTIASLLVVDADEKPVDGASEPVALRYNAPLPSNQQPSAAFPPVHDDVVARPQRWNYP